MLADDHLERKQVNERDNADVFTEYDVVAVEVAEHHNKTHVSRPKMSSKELMEKAGFGGGCHWCTEAVFQALRGVCKVEQGFISSAPPNEAFSEAALVTFDPSEISLTTLIEVHLHTHSSTNMHAFREKYRSAVYMCDEAQGDDARRVISKLQDGFDAPIITSVLDLRAFKASTEKFQNYYKKSRRSVLQTLH